MKKILLLGGSAQQVIAIETAKKLGYYTILCDYLTDNPGQFVADKFYLKSTTSIEDVLQIAKENSIDGILAYASDPAAPIAAYVAEKLGLPTNPYKSVYTLCNKDYFRKFLSENGFNTPKSKGFTDTDDIINIVHNFQLPVIIKPVDSSGSKGATVIHSWEMISEAIDFAFSFSRCKRIIVEEYIEKAHPYLIGGDVFIIDGEIKIWGLMNCHRDTSVNSLVPVGKSYPLKLSEEDINQVKTTLQNIVTKLKLKNGAMNVELIISKDGKVWPIDMGPRSGGNMIPDLMGYIFNVNIPELTINAAMGLVNNIKKLENNFFYCTHNLHSQKKGILKNISFSEEIEKYIVKKCFYKKIGDNVEYFDNASKALGIIFFKFENETQMHEILNDIYKYIKIEVS